MIRFNQPYLFGPELENVKEIFLPEDDEDDEPIDESEEEFDRVDDDFIFIASLNALYRPRELIVLSLSSNSTFSFTHSPIRKRILKTRRWRRLSMSLLS